MIKLKFGSFLIAFAIVLFTLDFPITGGLTTSRIAFVVLLSSYLILGSNKKFNSHSSKYRLIFVSMIFSIISTALSSLYYMEDFSSLITWVFSFISILIITINCMDSKVYDYILRYSFYLIVILVTVIFLFSLMKFGFYANQSFVMRYNIDDFGPGLSRIVNGLVFMKILMFLFVYREQRAIIALISIITLLMTVWFIFSTHSRQGLILLTLIALAILIIYVEIAKHKKILVLLSLIAFSYNIQTILSNQTLQDRFIKRTVNQLDSGEGSTVERIYFFNQGIEFFQKNIFVGIGPKNYTKIVGLDAHGGYILEISETGVLAFFGILVFFVFVIRKIFNGFREKKTIALSIILLVIALSPFFNSIYNSPMFWIITLLVTISAARSVQRTQQLIS